MRRSILTSVDLRRRAALEVGGLAVAAALFLVLVPSRPVVVDMALAALALVVITLGRNTTRHDVWGPGPPAGAATRATWILAAATLAATVIIGIVGPLRPGGSGALFSRSLVATLLVFVPWAWLQHVMFQFYLLGRLRLLFDRRGALAVAAVNASLFAASHAPDWDVVLVTWPVGWLWSVYYLRARRLVPIAISHALLATAYFYWVRGEDLLVDWLAAGR